MESTSGRTQGEDNEAVGEDVEGRGDEGRLHQRGTPDIGGDASQGETQRDAPDDDVGVPGDDEIGKPD
jgi:hypothetical protein